MNLPAVIISGLRRTPFGLELSVDIKSSQDGLDSLASNWWASFIPWRKLEAKNIERNAAGMSF